MRAFSNEQLLAVADEVCAQYQVRVRSFSALAACAAVPGARIHGVPVFDSVEDAAAALARTVAALRPLSGANQALAAVAEDVFRAWAEAN
ncbi:hypothetical protein CAPI_00045 [Corynebacterium capitovis DSM 44611]|uniref:hypothetical protein n=1 Tax=Corynebacterium capitovis TaxID=131081 RepID=UPI00047772E7|nr:hypothetical protein [Corynebacterium capitovis]WKD56599.1 hypothetical protein CAPI_00045 [Corynebacterium capitovis DSM 44611]